MWQVPRILIQFFPAHAESLVHVDPMVPVCNGSIYITQVLFILLYHFVLTSLLERLLAEMFIQ